MRKKACLLLLLLFLFTGCTANYTIEVKDGKITEEFYVIEKDKDLATTYKDDMDSTFDDYAKMYGINDNYYASYYNMYNDEESICHETEKHRCDYYNKEYINNEDGIGFKLSSTFTYDDYADATIPNDLMPGFTSKFDGKYLVINGGTNWDFLKGYENLEKVNIRIKSDYYVTSTNMKYKGNGLYEVSVDKNNNNDFPEIYITFDTTKTKRLGNENAQIVGIIMVSIIGVVILFTIIRLFQKNKKNNKV